jgi:hypothetical protein
MTMHPRRRLQRLLAGAAVLFAFAVAAPVSQAAPAELCSTVGAGVVPLTETCGGKSYSDWSAAFWQYVLSQPASANPLVDSTGATCQTGQSGQVFFLVGSFVGNVDRRDCAVPAGKTLFFPLVNIVDLNTPPGSCRAVQDMLCAPETPDQLRSDIKPLEDGASGLHASIDGVAVANPASFRLQSPIFSVQLPADNFFGLPAQAYLTVADGYYVMVAPLPSGKHTVRFGGTDGGGFTQNITYRFTIP